MTTLFPRRALRRLLVVPVAGLALACSIVVTGDGRAEAATTWNLLGNGTPDHPSDSDSVATELGLRFSSSQSGSALGVRFYKSSANTGTHTGSLWTATGTKLASATFTGETASGWQTVRFAQPVALKADSDYVVSYHTDDGHYASDVGGLASPITNGPLTGAGSVYRYGASGFPTSSHKATNYWVDVMVSTGTTSTSTPATSPPATNPTSTSGWPDASNTGVPAGTSLTPRGGFTVSTAGTVLDALDVTGTVIVTAPNVTIRRSRFTGTGQSYGVQVKGGNVRIEDCEFHGNYGTSAVGYENWTMVRSEISGVTSDGVKIGDNTLMEDNWLHDFTAGTNEHADGGQVENGIENAVIRHNNVALTTGQNSALFIASSLGPDGDGPVVVEDNLLGGGNFSLYVLDGDYGNYIIKNITVKDNKFLRTARYGPTSVRVPVTESGNAWADTGAVIAL